MVQDFQILYLRDTYNRGQFIAARQLNFEKPIEILDRATLNDIPVYHYKQMYPILDGQGQPQFDVYVFRPNLERFPTGYFQEGQIVKLFNPE